MRAESAGRATQQGVVLGAVIAVCGAGCNSPAGPPEREAAVRPALEFLQSQRGRMRDGGILFVQMVPVDTSFRLGRHEYLLLSVTSAAGESEALRLRREVCGLDAGQSYACNFFAVSVRSGHDVREIEPGLRGLNARLTLVAPIPTYGSAYAFGNWGRAMSAARRLPNVTNVDVVRILASGVVSVPFAARLAAAAPFSRGVPRPGDGTVTALPSDTLVISYRQPDGSTLTHRVSPPPLGTVD